MARLNSLNDMIAEHVNQVLLSEVGWMIYLKSA